MCGRSRSHHHSIASPHHHIITASHHHIAISFGRHARAIRVFAFLPQALAAACALSLAPAPPPAPPPAEAEPSAAAGARSQGEGGEGGEGGKGGEGQPPSMHTRPLDATSEPGRVLGGAATAPATAPASGPAAASPSLPTTTGGTGAAEEHGSQRMSAEALRAARLARFG